MAIIQENTVAKPTIMNIFAVVLRADVNALIKFFIFKFLVTNERIIT
ncbi:hypothetical protein ES705_23294 [subsurface metagenome]